jgi:hypothetical protein
MKNDYQNQQSLKTPVKANVGYLQGHSFKILENED